MNANKTIFIIPTPEQKPIKIVFQDDMEVNEYGNDIAIKRKLSGIEAEKFITDIFGSTDIAVIPTSEIREDLWYCPHCSSILDLTQIDSCMNTPNEIVDYCLECGNVVSRFKDALTY